jgi:hypothetical protein
VPDLVGNSFLSNRIKSPSRVNFFDQELFKFTHVTLIWLIFNTFPELESATFDAFFITHVKIPMCFSLRNSFWPSPHPPHHLSLPSPLTSSRVILKYVDDARSSSFTCLPFIGSCPGCLSSVLRLVVLGSCLTMISIPKDSYKTPHTSVIQLPRAESLCSRRVLAGRM